VRARGWIWLAVIALAAGAGIWALMKWKSQPSEVQFARVARTTIHSAVPTNGKVEPIEWAVARAERSGPVKEILVQRGQIVAKNAPLVQLDSAEAQANLASAQARIAQARAELDVVKRGGRATDLADISSGLERARLDLANAQREYDALKRLQEKQSATMTISSSWTFRPSKKGEKPWERPPIARPVRLAWKKRRLPQVWPNRKSVKASCALRWTEPSINSI
jgi:multidrug efflux pump subunit AcrA (membrane-fusion protein)